MALSNSVSASCHSYAFALKNKTKHHTMLNVNNFKFSNENSIGLQSFDVVARLQGLHLSPPWLYHMQRFRIQKFCAQEKILHSCAYCTFFCTIVIFCVFFSILKGFLKSYIDKLYINRKSMFEIFKWATIG